MTVYHKRKLLDRLILGVVVIIAGVVIALSFHSTAGLARQLGLNQYLTAGLVEVLFASLLFIRGRQRATQRNVPTFLEIGYFISLAFVTGVNMYGLSAKNPVIGPIVGLAISGAMWLMESVLVWLWTAAHEPHQKSPRELMREAKEEIAEMKAIQRIEWMKWEAQKPDLRLILEARAAEEKRKQVIGDGLPEFFTREPEPIPQLVAEPVEVVQETEKEEQAEETAEVIPMKRQIGFHMEQPKPTPSPAPRFQPNLEARAQAIEVAKELRNELGRIPTKGELMERGLTEYYAKWAKGELKREG